MRRFLLAILALAVPAGVLAAYAFAESRADPLVRHAGVALPGWPAGAPPIRVALLSDLHVGNASTDPARLARVVAQVDAQAPDLVLIAGDFLAGAARIAPADARLLLAPLAGLHAPLGVAAVSGNHDHWTMPDRATGGLGPVLAPLGVTLLVNRAIRAGPLALGGIDDGYTHHARIAPTVAQVRALPGARVLLTHSPDIAPRLPADMPLLLAGHTHCGQVVLPLVGPVQPVSRYRRYECGLAREPGRTTIVGAGIGTSSGPFRLNAPPDWWLVTLGPDRPAARVR